MAAIQQPGAIRPEMQVISRLVLDRRIAAHHAFADRQFPRSGSFDSGQRVGHEQRWKGYFQRTILEFVEDVRATCPTGQLSGMGTFFAVSGVSTNPGLTTVTDALRGVQDQFSNT